jgi:hypothetical protein
MLCSGLVEYLCHLSPIFPLILGYILENNQILLFAPIAFPNALIQMVLPAFPALFGCFKKFATRFLVKLFGDFVPLAQFEIPT